jgi:hypothetical protein
MNQRLTTKTVCVSNQMNESARDQLFDSVNDRMTRLSVLICVHLWTYLCVLGDLCG